ncbi:MAG: Ubiquinone biosynthesis O-methyltransferase [Planctomycetota bacterium]|jgi:2-polyprenyl-3-methyl-5-hydroxy-6-metoxy-1,4-benzoquinol methylase
MHASSTSRADTQPARDRPLPHAPDIGAVARRVFTDGPLLQRVLQHHRHRIAPVARCIELIPQDSDVLDIGCGGGLFLACLAASGRIARGHGIDSSASAIATANAAAQRLRASGAAAQLTFEHRSVEAGLPDQRYGAVAMIDVMHHIPPAAQQQAFADALARVQPGGIFLYKDMCDAPFWRRGMNRLHDLTLARQWISELPIERADAWAADEGFDLTLAEERRILWYGHEIRVYRRPAGATPRA